MRKVTYGGAASLDLFFARQDHSVDWLRWSDEVGELIGAYWKNIDAVLMGRKTFQVAQQQGQGGAAPGIDTYVFTRTLPDPPPPGVEFVRRDAVEFVRNLKQMPGKEICLMGGGELAQSLLEAGLVDEVGFNLHPLLLGSGIPALRPLSHQVELELKECRVLKNGCVYLVYRCLN